MQSEVLQKIIHEALENARTVEGTTILDKFYPVEVGDFVNAILYALPLYPDQIVDQVQARVLDVLPSELKDMIITNQIKDLHRLHLTGKNNKEQLMLLIFLLLVEYKNTFGEDITEKLQEIKDYYYSYLIHTADELKLEVAENPEQATSHVLHNYFIRLTNEYEFVPTTSTKLEYFNYLYNLKP